MILSENEALAAGFKLSDRLSALPSTPADGCDGTHTVMHAVRTFSFIPTFGGPAQSTFRAAGPPCAAGRQNRWFRRRIAIPGSVSI